MPDHALAHGKADVLRLQEKAVRQRLPLSGTLELTRSCNLRCVHCYQASSRRGRPVELDTGRWLALIDEIVAAGCLNLLLTGGEPLLREDFGKVYRYARERGLLVTIFTNGTRVSREIVELFRDLPPVSVEISLYGASEEVYEAVTGVRGSYRRCLEGIDSLLAGGVNLSLKTVLMRRNIEELSAMEAMAEERGVKFRIDGGVFPGLDGDRGPLEERVPAAAVVEAEFADPARSGKWVEYLRKEGGKRGGEELYSCGAGLTSFHVLAEGRMTPCLMLTEPFFDLGEGSFVEGWETVLARFRELKAGPDYPCRSCGKRAVCGLCPAFFALESGREEEPSAFLCEIGDRRMEALEKAMAGEACGKV
jgi:radical SAM protein with 4Fe4S-binding SPASM domain